MKRWSVVLACCLGWTVVAGSIAASGSADRLQRLFEEVWNFDLREFPTWATGVGVHDYNDRLPSQTLADIERRTLYWRQALERLREIDPVDLSSTDRVSYRMFEQQLRDRIEEFEFQQYLLPLTAEGGFHTAFARLADNMPFLTVRDYENYAARLRAYRSYTEQHIDLLELSIDRGYTLPRVVLEGYEGTIRPHIVDEAEKSVFWAPFERFPSSVPPSEHERLRQAGSAAILESVVPAYREFLDFMTSRYIPACRTSLAAGELPGGTDYYAYLVRHFTTLDISPREVHEIGLAEVERIRAEMMAVKREVGFEGELKEFLEFLRTDPRFFVDTPEALLKEAAWIAKTMDGKLPAIFGTIPRLPYTVEPVPDPIAAKYTAGRYVGPPYGSTRPGIYWVNTFALESRPLWALTALTLHEAVPGHHFQNAISRELDELPSFRRFAYVNAFGEGWGLYSEWLGIETGMYSDPYDNFGRLAYEMWRACRLVVDTGIHAFGWSRDEAMEFMAANTSLSLHEIETETDRYISWPGQALAYKMGEIKIKELRRRAEAALGERFDVRAFHDAVLGEGTVPLIVLEEQIASFIEDHLEEDAGAP